MIISNAKVKIQVINDLPMIIVNNEYKHTFNTNSNIYKIFKKQGIKHLLSLINNGYFFIIDDTIVDLRYNDYNGYIYNNSKKLIDTLGYVKNPSQNLRKSLKANNVSNDLLIKFSHNSSLIFEGYIDDADTFETGMVYQWSAFQNHIKGIPYLKYKELYYFSSEFDTIFLNKNWERIISDDISDTIKKYFDDKLEKLWDTKIDKMDLEYLITLASMNDDIEAKDYFENITDLDYSKYDALCYVLELSEYSAQFGHGFKYLKILLG